MLRTLGTKDRIRFVINKVLTPKGNLRVKGREDRVKLLRTYLSISETNGEVRPLLNSHEGIELLQNIRYSRGGSIQTGGYMTNLLFKGVEVAHVNTMTINSQEVSEETTQSAEYKEYRALVGKIFEENRQIVSEVAKSTEVSPVAVQCILNDDGGQYPYYAPHTQEQIEMMVMDKKKYVNVVKMESHDVVIARLRKQLNDPDLLRAGSKDGGAEVDISLLLKSQTISLKK